MAASLADIREKLGKLTLYQLQALAKSLNLQGCSGLNKPQLEERLVSQAGEVRLGKALFPTWWARNRTDVSIALTVVGLALGLLAFYPRDNASERSVEKAVEARNPEIARLENKDLTVPVVITPPSDFPSPEIAGVKPLTDDERASGSFADTKVMIRNETGKNLKLAFAYKPYRERNPQIADSPYVQRESPEVLAGDTLEKHESNFGGPVHVSVFADGKWTATNEWFDLRVVPSRTLVVTEKGGLFSCRVEFEEGPR